MLPGKEELLARYSKKEVAADAFGRLITVVRLKFSEVLAIRRMAETEDVTSLAYMLAAASVRNIDDNPLPFPRNMLDLNTTIDLLDQEGIGAAIEASAKLRDDAGAADPKASAQSPVSASSAS